MSATVAARPPLAERLRDLADQASRLPPPAHRDPERFHIAKSQLARALWRLANEVGQPS